MRDQDPPALRENAGSSRRTALSLVAGLLVIGWTLQPAAARAEWTPLSLVSRVWQGAAAHGGGGHNYPAGSGYIHLATQPCSLNSQAYYLVDGNDAKQAAVMSLFLAAFLSGKEVQIEWIPFTVNSRTHCLVQSVIVGRP